MIFQRQQNDVADPTMQGCLPGWGTQVVQNTILNSQDTISSKNCLTINIGSNLHYNLSSHITIHLLDSGKTEEQVTLTLTGV